MKFMEKTKEKGRWEKVRREEKRKVERVKQRMGKRIKKIRIRGDGGERAYRNTAGVGGGGTRKRWSKR